MRRADVEALALGLLHGPAELVPVSSSGHVTAVPWLLRWEIAGWSGARRKELEVALHGGTALALLLVAAAHGDGPAPPVVPRRGRRGLLAAAVLPPALAGLALERRIEARLGTPATLAAGLLAGAVALALADRAPATRRAEDATVADGLWLGAAQAAALVPGVSRSGATLAAARARGFARADASRLSWEVALPVLVGATGLKAARVAARHTGRGETAGAGPASGGATANGAEPASGGATAANHPTTGGGARPLAVGAATAFASTLFTTGAIGLERRAPLWPWAAWRAGLAAAILAVRQNRGR
jgi:undecaprenyl-diphosphatase